jgi:phosphatidylglycerol:prolipoprotein diacylglycerol transferase
VIPYSPQPSLLVGPFNLYACGLLLMAGIVAGSFTFSARAEGIGLDKRTAWRLVLIVVPVGLLGAHLLYCAFEDPNALFKFGGISSFGGAFGGICVVTAYVYFRGSSVGELWKWLDAAAYSSVFASFVARLGCSLAHDHLGMRSSSWISVNLPGGPRYDLGLLEALFLGLLSVVLVLLDRKASFEPVGLIASTVAFSYGVLRFCLAYLHETPDRVFGLAIEQYGALTLLGISLYGFHHLRAGRRQRLTA